MQTKKNKTISRRFLSFSIWTLCAFFSWAESYISFCEYSFRINEKNRCKKWTRIFPLFPYTYTALHSRCVYYFYICHIYAVHIKNIYIYSECVYSNVPVSNKIEQMLDINMLQNIHNNGYKHRKNDTHGIFLLLFLLLLMLLMLFLQTQNIYIWLVSVPWVSQRDAFSNWVYVCVCVCFKFYLQYNL